jgi:hypothetical protein
MLIRAWDDAPCFVPGFYTYLARANAESLFAWRSTLAGAVDVRVYHVTQLEPVDPLVDPDNKRDVVLRRASELVHMPRLAPGTHHGFEARTLVDFQELLLLASWPSESDSDPALAIYSWEPASGAVTVTPQPWISAATHDLGYEWVTRVVRDPNTGRIVGDGVRLGAFELEGDDMTIRQWFTDAWGQPIASA